MNWLIEHEQIIRPAVFFVIFLILASAEIFRPLAKRKCARVKQWLTNLSMAVLANVSLKLLLPILAVAAAQFAQNKGLGLLNLFELPYPVQIFIALLLLDFVIYGQHLLMHRIPLLWALHRVHHTEISLDVSSAVRFHPIEIMLSMFIKISFVVLIGAPAAAVILFEILLNALALFNHSNLKLPGKVDKVLRKLIVTPQVHWIHHSPINTETNSNYGFFLSIWDYLFHTYTSHYK